MRRRSFWALALLMTIGLLYLASAAGEVLARPKSGGAPGGSGAPSGNTVTYHHQADGTLVRQTCYAGRKCTRVKVEPTQLRWEQSTVDANSVFLYHGDVQVGVWGRVQQAYYPLVDGEVDKDHPCKPPLPRPADDGPVLSTGATTEALPRGHAPGSFVTFDGREVYTGVEPDRIKPGDCYSINGRECNREGAFEFLGGAGGRADVPDDRHKPSFTVIGDKPTREAVRAAMANDPELQPLRQHVCEQYYDPADPMIANLGYTSPVNVQDANGQMLCRGEDTSPATVAAVLNTALRQRDPNFNPARVPTPGGGTPFAGLFKDFGEVSPMGWALIGVAATLIFTRKRPAL